MTVPKTLQQYLLGELKDHPEQYELVMMMADIATIGKLISARTNRAGLTDIIGSAGTTNVQDETQAKLDIYANDLCKNYLRSTGLFASLASEEEDVVVDLENPGANYVIAFDPLDGSSNIDVNVGIGTIFSVHKKLDGVPAGDERQFLQPGRDQVLAGYMLYGSSTMLVFSCGEGVHAFTLDVDLGEFLLGDAGVKIPDVCPYYSFNESYAEYVSAEDKVLLDNIRHKAGKLRWIGSLVADFHRNMIKGGVFVLPAFDTSGKGDFKPKLRLNYEAKPIAFLAEQAGGAAVSGNSDILDIVPRQLHERVAVIIGNKNIVKEAS
ncbi:MAG TPA: class 1 fructose-bisphosphatase [Candidatus Saccharimonadales bacterium]